MLSLSVFIASLDSPDFTPRIGEHRHSSFYEETRSLLPVLGCVTESKGSCQITKCHLMSVLLFLISILLRSGIDTLEIIPSHHLL